MRRQAALGTIMATALAVAATGCGGDDGGGEKAAGADGLVPVTFNAISVAQLAPIVLGNEQGIFEAHGIDLTINFVEPATVVPSLVSGDADFGWLNAPAVLAARGNNVPVKSVTTTSTAGDAPESFSIQLMVAGDSDIKTPQDLLGKKVAVDTLFQLPDLGMRDALIDAGVDPEQINAVEIPFPNMGDALMAGRVDAILSTEPFVTINGESVGAVPFLSASAGQEASSPQSVILSSEQFLEGNADLVDDFREAVDESSEFAIDNDEEMRATIPTFTQLDPELASVINLAPIDTTDDPEGWDAWADLLVEVGALDEKPDSEAAFLVD